MSQLTLADNVMNDTGKINKKKLFSLSQIQEIRNIQ